MDIRPEVRYKLRLDLEKIDNALNKINDQYKRKRMINITYLIKSEAKGFKSMMEDQVIFQNRRIRHEKKISVINYCHNFIQRNIPFEIVFKKVFINQTTFDVTFICIKIIC